MDLAEFERLLPRPVWQPLDDDLEAWLYPDESAPPTEPVPPSLIDDAVRDAVTAIQRLIVDPHAQLDMAALEQLAVGVEQVRRCAESAAVAVAERVDSTNPYRRDGFFNGKAWLRHRLQLTKSEAFRRVQGARAQQRIEPWTSASQLGEVGVAQSQLMAQIAANPRIGDEQLQEGAPELLADAKELSYDAFERRARRWEQQADPIGAADNHRRLVETRDASMKSKATGGWTLTARFDELSGARFNETFAGFIEHEWEADWADATKRCGDDATTADLRRTETQRRADALLAMSGAAAAAPPNAMRPIPTFNVLFDAVTLQSVLHGEHVPASRYRDVVCRTQSGRELHLAEAASLVLWAEVRRVLLDDRGVTVNFGRRQRTFRGAAREAALLLATTCVWPGCDVPVGRCEVDHARSWKKHHGGTDQENGDPLCRWHNRLKETGFRIERDESGTWRVFHPDGHEIV